MNIDLLFTASGTAGLLSGQNLVKKAAGVVFDVESGLLTIEYADMDFMEMNIPVEKEFHATLDLCPQIHIGSVKDGVIAQAYQVPFMFLDDPYRMEAFKDHQQPANPLEAFGYFVRTCMFGQPVHRDDLGNEDAMGCILGDAAPSSLQFAPHLARQMALQAGLRAAPQGPGGPSGPGLGGGGGGSRAGQIRTGGHSGGQPPKKGDSKES